MIVTGRKSQRTGIRQQESREAAITASRRERSQMGTLRDEVRRHVSTGVKKGDCYVYVYAQNGVYKRVTVNVR